VFAAHGHEARRMSLKYGRPCIKAQKNDDRDDGTGSKPLRSRGYRLQR
jgi:hypothetical protein